MKFPYLVLGPLSLAAAIVIPDDQVLASLTIEHSKDDLRPCHSHREISQAIEDAVLGFASAIDDAVDSTSSMLDKPTASGASTRSRYLNHTTVEDSPESPKWAPGPRTPCFLTVYEEIVRSRHTTKLAKLINQDKTLVSILNNTALDHTVFAPSDCAFEDFLGNLSAWSRDDLRATFLYHVSPGLFSTETLGELSTLPTLLNQSALYIDGMPQILTLRLEDEELVVGSQAMIKVADIPATNGYLHLIDKILSPPEPVTHTLQAMPTEFSTLMVALIRSHLHETLHGGNTIIPSHPGNASHRHHNYNNHNGTTLFAPLNTAFLALPPPITEFLFSSQQGEKYLRALMEYHLVVNHTLFSDVLYTDKGDVVEFGYEDRVEDPVRLELPTMLGNCSVTIDIVRGDKEVDGKRRIRVNRAEVEFVDSGTRFGVMHPIDRVLIPGQYRDGDEGELTVKELMDRMSRCVEQEKPEDDVWSVEHVEL